MNCFAVIALVAAVLGGGSAVRGGGFIGSLPKPEPDYYKMAGPLKVSKEGYNLIIKHEVGGVSYYQKRLSRPSYPGGASGVTIGCGADLGWTSRAQIAKDWGAHVSSDVLKRLQSCSGIKGAAAKRHVRTMQSIIIPWGVAQKVFDSSTLPRFGKLTAKAYSGITNAHPHIQSSFLSWTFNRGSGISSSSSRDREKRALRKWTAQGAWSRCPAEFRSSKRLWRGRGLDGLLRRREAEAVLIEKGVAAMGR